MIINVAKLKKGGERFQGEEPASILELDGLEEMRADKPIRYDLAANMAGTNLVVQGAVKVEMAFACVRCARFVRITVSEPAFLRAIEVSPENELVDLTDDIREAVILAIPSKPLCSAGCKGLCAGCGADLNREKCRCAPGSADCRWGALDGVKFQ